MAIAAYTKTCAKNVAGNFNKVFFNKISEVKTCTLASGEITTGFAIDSAKFQMYQAEIDSVQFKMEGNGAQNYFTTQTITMKFAKKTVGLVAAIDALAAEIPCGVAIIHVDGNGVAWLSGYDVAAYDPTSRPFNKMKVTFDSGTKPSDAEGNAVIVELSRESEWANVPFNATISAAIISGTATTIIDYT